MSRKDRIWAAVTRCERPDRVPVSPMISNGAAGALQGMSQGQVYGDPYVALEAIKKTFDDYGGWDAVLVPVFTSENALLKGCPYEWKLPGRDIPDDYVLQIHEQENIKAEEYEEILSDGYFQYYFRKVLPRVSHWREGDREKYETMLIDLYAKTKIIYDERQTPMMYGNSSLHPFFRLGMGRSFMPFTNDLYNRRQLTKRVLDRIMDDWLETIVPSMLNSDIKIFGCIEERASAYNYPLEIFEDVWIPLTVRMIDALWSQGIVTMFHLDQPWNKNLPLIKKYLPKGSFGLQLDGTTDIFEAKDFMRDHCSFQGDVPASLLSLGTPEEVTAYCNRLIKEVGYDGGFTLVSGCEVPADVKPENLKAMIEAGKNSYYE